MAKNFMAPDTPKTFIDFESRMSWQERIEGQLKVWQKNIQDLPASIEAHLKQLWEDNEPKGNGKQV